MEKNFREKIDDYKSFSKSIKKLYLDLIKLEQNGQKKTNEYNEIFDLIKVAVEIEKKKFNVLNINEKNVKYLKNILDENTEYSQQRLLDQEDDNLELLRNSNQVDEYCLSQDNFIDSMKTTNIFEVVTKLQYEEILTSLKYATKYYSVIINNFIKLLSIKIENETNTDLKNYYIYLKYILISTNPEYENNYLFFRKELPYRTLNRLDVEIKDIDESEMNGLNYYTIKTEYLDDLLELLCLDNKTLYQDNNYKYAKRIAFINTARLIALNNYDQLEELMLETEMILPENENYSDAIDIIQSIFDDAIKVMNNNQLKKRL